MLKIPFHTCDKGGEVIFPVKINPFFYFYDKSTLGITKPDKKYLVFQNKFFKFKKYEFKTFKDGEVSRFETFVCTCKKNCTANIIERCNGKIKLKYNYDNCPNKSFDGFWKGEFKRNLNRYTIITGSFNNGKILGLTQDYFIKRLRVYPWEFGTKPIFDLVKDTNVDVEFLLRTDSEVGFVLITSNFVFERGNFNLNVSDTIRLSFLFNLHYINERQSKLYEELKKRDQEANHVLVFSHKKGLEITIVLDYFTISQGVKTVWIYKNKNFSSFIL